MYILRTEKNAILSIPYFCIIELIYKDYVIKMYLKN